MIKIGLTGSIGMGKSTTAEMFREAGIPVYDADATVHELYSGEAVHLIEQAFPGTEINGKIDRSILGAKVIGNSDEMKRLEAIVHPLVHAKEKKFLENAEESGSKIVVLDIPLLFETGGKSRVDVIVVVSARPEEQRKRVLAREGMTEEKFAAILAKQVPDQEKRKQADFVVETDDGMASARKQVDRIISELS